MTKKGFTLIELIFVIVIIGMLAATAIPKFKNLKENAELNNLAKIIADMQSSVPAAYINTVDLEGDAVDSVRLNELVKTKGKDWKFDETHNRYIYKETVAYVMLVPSTRQLTAEVYCDSFSTSNMQEKCKRKFAADTNGSSIETIDF